jgi:hypothetical protein
VQALEQHVQRGQSSDEGLKSLLDEIKALDAGIGGGGLKASRSHLQTSAIAPPALSTSRRQNRKPWFMPFRWSSSASFG